MFLHQIMIETQKERYKIAATMQFIINQVCGLTETATRAKYREVPLIQGDEEYEFFDAKASMFMRETDVYLSEVELQLFYFRKSNVSKEERRKINVAIQAYKKYKMVPPEINDKSTLWLTVHFKIDVKDAIKGDFELIFSSYLDN